MSEPRPQVTVEPCMRFGEPAIRGVSVDAIAGMVWAGESVDGTAEDYNLTREQVLVACWFAARHGTRAWRKRWGAWLNEHGDSFWHSNWSQISDPPCHEGGPK